MAESSENWNIEIIPGARRVRQATAFVKRIAMLGTQTELCLSGHIVDRVDTGAAAMLDTALDEPEQYYLAVSTKNKLYLVDPEAPSVTEEML